MLSPLLESKRILFFFRKKGLDLIKTKVLHPAPWQGIPERKKNYKWIHWRSTQRSLSSPTVVAASQIFLTSRDEEDPGWSSWLDPELTKSQLLRRPSVAHRKHAVYPLNTQAKPRFHQDQTPTGEPQLASNWPARGVQRTPTIANEKVK